MYRKVRQLIMISLLCGAFGPVDAEVLYVNSMAEGAGNGTSWIDAFNDLQIAIAMAGEGDEIWVAQGLYLPSPDHHDPTVAFQLKSDVAIYGGFGATETQLDERDFRLYQTILSGDIGFENMSLDNSFHVVDASFVNKGAVLDGFTIQAGNARGLSDSEHLDVGGGLYALNGSPTVRNCNFVDNRAARGGAVSLINGFPVVKNCGFYGNSATDYGGALTQSDGSLLLVNCLFSGNSANFGGALYQSGLNVMTVAHCTFSGNVANLGGGGVALVGESSIKLENSILWDNACEYMAPEIFEGGTGLVDVRFCIVAGGYVGSNILDVDPMFEDSDGEDNELGTPDDDYRLEVLSPAINVGNPVLIEANDTLIPTESAVDSVPFKPDTDLGGNPRLTGGGPDLGAFEYAVAVGGDAWEARQRLALEVYPMPVNKYGWIEFNVEPAQKIRIEILDLLGQRVYLVQDEKMETGQYVIPFPANKIPSGIYLLSVTGEDFIEIQEIILRK